MKKRSLEYEQKFKKYLYSFDFETHKTILREVINSTKKGYEDIFRVVK